MDMKIKRGQILRDLRKSKGLTQSFFSEKLNISQAAYQKYEYGTAEPTFDTLSQLADFYGVTTDYLLGREPCNDPIEQLPVGEQDRAIIQAYINLSDKERTEFVEILRKIVAGADIKMVISHEHQESEIHITKTAARNGGPPGERIRTQEEINEIRSRPDADPDL